MKVIVKKIDHVQICIPVGAEVKAREFYTDILGFKEMEKPQSLKPNGGLWYDLGSVQLHIGVEDTSAYNSKRHPAFVVDNLAAVRRYLEEHGVATQDEKPIPGVRRFTFYDPFGNRIEFMEHFHGRDTV